MKKYQKWNTPQALADANRKIGRISKGESIEQGLYAEWMAVNRARQKSKQLYRNLFSNLTLDQELLIAGILDTVEKHEDRIDISRRLVDRLTVFVDASNCEPRISLTMPLADFQNLCSKVVYAAGEYYPWSPQFRYDFIMIEREEDRIKAEAKDTRISAVATMPAKHTFNTGRFSLQKKAVLHINKLAGSEITIEFLKNSMHISIDGQAESVIPRPGFHVDHPIIKPEQTPGLTFLRGSRKDFLTLFRKFRGKAHEVKVVMKRDSSYVMRPVRFYTKDSKTSIKIELSADSLTWNGDDLKIGVNNKTVYDIVRHAPESELTIAFWSPDTRFVTKSKEEDYEVHAMAYSPAEKR